MLHYLICAPAFVVAASIFMLVRNRWVYRTRIRILNSSRWDSERWSHVEYDSLPSYDAMMLQFWNWNGDSFIGRCPVGGKFAEGVS